MRVKPAARPIIQNPMHKSTSSRSGANQGRDRDRGWGREHGQDRENEVHNSTYISKKPKILKLWKGRGYYGSNHVKNIKE